MSIERVLNSGWWARALLERRVLDTTEHVGERAHQKVDPEAHAPHALEHELTAWEREWLAARVIDAHTLHADQRAAALELLAEPYDEQLTRELEARARHHFGTTHDDARDKLLELARDEEDPEVLARLESHMDYIDRHVATVEAELADRRRIAQTHIDDAALLEEHGTQLEHVVRAHREVRDAIRSTIAEALAAGN